MKKDFNTVASELLNKGKVIVKKDVNSIGIEYTWLIVEKQPHTYISYLGLSNREVAFLDSLSVLSNGEEITLTLNKAVRLVKLLVNEYQNLESEE